MAKLPSSKWGRALMDSTSSTPTNGNGAGGGNTHPLDRLIAQLSQGDDYFHPAIRIAWEIGQRPINLRDAMLYQRQFAQLLEDAEQEERAVRALASELGRVAITRRG